MITVSVILESNRELGRIKLSNFNLLSHKVFILAICLRLSIIEIITFTSVVG